MMMEALLPEQTRCAVLPGTTRSSTEVLLPYIVDAFHLLVWRLKL